MNKNAGKLTMSAKFLRQTGGGEEHHQPRPAYRFMDEMFQRVVKREHNAKAQFAPSSVRPPSFAPLLSILYCIHHRSTEKKTHTQNNFLRMNRLEAGLAILGGSQTIKLSKSRFNFVFPLLSLPLGRGSRGNRTVGEMGGIFTNPFKAPLPLIKANGLGVVG